MIAATRNCQIFAVVTVLIYTLVSACTSVVSSNPRQVIVESQMMNAPKAQALADAECAKQQRHAVMTTKADYWERNYIFSCVD